MALIPFINAMTIICSCFNARRSFNTRNNLIKRRIIIMLPLPVGKNEPTTTIKSNYCVVDEKEVAGERGGGKRVRERGLMRRKMKMFRKKLYSNTKKETRYKGRDQYNFYFFSYLIPIIIKIFERLQLKARHFQNQFEDKHPLDNRVNKV